MRSFKYIATFLFFLATISSVTAAVNWTGQTIDSITGNAITGVVIDWNGTEVTSNATGHYISPNFANGSWSINYSTSKTYRDVTTGMVNSTLLADNTTTDLDIEISYTTLGRVSEVIFDVAPIFRAFLAVIIGVMSILVLIVMTKFILQFIGDIGDSVTNRVKNFK